VGAGGREIAFLCFLAPNMLLGLFTQLEGPGGVQRASRHLAAVLSEWADRRSWTYRLLSLNDICGIHRIEIAGRRCHFEGFARRKGSFLRATLSATCVGPKLVFVNHPNLTPLARVVQVLTSAPVIAVGWGVDVWEPLLWYRRWAMRRLDALLAISSYTAEQLIVVQKINPCRVRLFPLALEPVFWERTQKPMIQRRPAGFPGGRVVLTVTRLAAVDAYKGVDLLIQALARLPDDTHLVVVGDGDDRPRLQALARAQGVAHRVHFLGALEREELVACYQHCDIFALPSKGEGFGLVFLEAMAFGKPVVGGAHGGTPDIIEHGTSGFLVPHGDVEPLTATLLRLLTDPALCAEVGRRARERVAQHYLFPQFAARLHAILDELLAR